MGETARFKKRTRECRNARLKKGDVFFFPLELFWLRFSFFAYSPLLDALSHCKHKAPTVSKKAKIVSKKAPTVSKKAKIVTVSRKLPTVSKKAASELKNH